MNQYCLNCGAEFPLHLVKCPECEKVAISSCCPHSLVDDEEDGEEGAANAAETPKKADLTLAQKKEIRKKRKLARKRALEDDFDGDGEDDDWVSNASAKSFSPNDVGEVKVEGFVHTPVKLGDVLGENDKEEKE
jgi:hypothetical protein